MDFSKIFRRKRILRFFDFSTKIASKKIEKKAHKKGSHHDTSESEQDSVDQENSNFEDTLFKSVAEATAPVKRIPSEQDGYKSLTKELAWYIESEKKVFLEVLL